MKRSLLFSLLLSFAVSVQAQNELDARAKARYSEADLAILPPYKIKQLNFFYNHSFEIKNTEKCIDCPEPDTKMIDIALYDHQRQEDRRVAIADETGRYKITMLSRNELQAAFDKIKEEFNTTK